VDVFPGDRAETCGGIMNPTGLSLDHGDQVIHHRCRTCGAERQNIAASDDALARLIEVSVLPR
jgi:RNHCP domain-containing protein